VVVSSASAPACDMVTVSGIAAAYGGTVSPGIPNITPGVTDSSSCVYAVKGNNVGIAGDAEVTVFPRPMDAIFLVDSSALHVAARAPFAYTPK